MVFLQSEQAFFCINGRTAGKNEMKKKCELQINVQTALHGRYFFGENRARRPRGGSCN